MTGSIDLMFAKLVIEGSWASYIAGFILVLAVIFMGVVAFGKAKVEIGTFGIILFTFIGVVIATVLKLFPIYVLLTFVVLSIAAIAIKKLIGGSA